MRSNIKYKKYDVVEILNTKGLADEFKDITKAEIYKEYTKLSVVIRINLSGMTRFQYIKKSHIRITG